MEGNGPHRSKNVRDLFYSRMIPMRKEGAKVLKCSRYDVLPVKNDLFVESGKMVV